ncbi:MAG: DUF2017 family protein [Cellulomonadaceae bacterium]
MRAFTADLRGYAAEMTLGERVALAQVAAEVVLLLETVAPDEAPLEDGLPSFDVESVESPRDPALARLFPDAVPTDPEACQEFRRLTQRELVDAKHTRLTALVDLLLRDTGYLERASWEQRDVERSFELLVPRERAEDIAAALTDVRLTLAERLGMHEDADVARLQDDVVAGWEGAAVLEDDAQHLGSIFLLAGFLQESLVDAMLTDLRGTRG